MRDLIERLERVVADLDRMAELSDGKGEYGMANHYVSKADGVRLALSYAREPQNV